MSVRRRKFKYEDDTESSESEEEDSSDENTDDDEDEDDDESTVTHSLHSVSFLHLKSKNHDSSDNDEDDINPDKCQFGNKSSIALLEASEMALLKDLGKKLSRSDVCSAWDTTMILGAFRQDMQAKVQGNNKGKVQGNKGVGGRQNTVKGRPGTSSSRALPTTASHSPSANYVFVHHSDYRKYMEQYRKKHTVGEGGNHDVPIKLHGHNVLLARRQQTTVVGGGGSLSQHMQQLRQCSSHDAPTTEDEKHITYPQHGISNIAQHLIGTPSESPQPPPTPNGRTSSTQNDTPSPTATTTDRKNSSTANRNILDTSTATTTPRNILDSTATTTLRNISDTPTATTTTCKDTPTTTTTTTTPRKFPDAPTTTTTAHRKLTVNLSPLRDTLNTTEEFIGLKFPDAFQQPKQIRAGPPMDLYTPRSISSAYLSSTSSSPYLSSPSSSSRYLQSPQSRNQTLHTPSPRPRSRNVTSARGTSQQGQRTTWRTTEKLSVNPTNFGSVAHLLTYVHPNTKSLLHASQITVSSTLKRT